MPPPTGEERASLEGWLDFYRTTLALKCEGLTEDQAREASVPPSSLTLLGLVQHMAEVERNWFRRVLAGEDVPPLYASKDDPGGHDEGFALSPEATLRAALGVWREEIAAGRTHCADRTLEDTGRFGGGEMSLRWIYTHMIAEYARHCGHADFLRERIDGATGV